MSKVEVIIFSLFLTALLVTGLIFVGMVDTMGQQFLNVALNKNLSVTELYVSK